MDTRLAPYPMPPGVKRLMPFQEYPFNGDGYAAAEVLRLRDKYDIKHVMETGTCYGSTTLFFAKHFYVVDTVEIHGPTHDVAVERLKEATNVHLIFGDSAKCIIRAGLYFLDGHWLDVCPLMSELDLIAKHRDPCQPPVIMIHDWQVPGRPDLGHDHFPDGTPFALPAIASHLDAIYGRGGWDHHYNDKAEGAKRGILYVEPKV